MKKFLLLSLLSLSSVSFVLRSSEIDRYAAALTMADLSRNFAASAAPVDDIILLDPVTEDQRYDRFTAPKDNKSIRKTKACGRKEKKMMSEYKNTCESCEKVIKGGAPIFSKHIKSGCPNNHYQCSLLNLTKINGHPCTFKYRSLKEFNEHLKRIHGQDGFREEAAYNQAVAKYNRNG
jgi:hypothetical protein